VAPVLAGEDRAKREFLAQGARVSSEHGENTRRNAGTHVVRRRTGAGPAAGAVATYDDYRLVSRTFDTRDFDTTAMTLEYERRP